MMHELGHALGLADLYSNSETDDGTHVDNSDLLMYGLDTNDCDIIIGEELINGIREIQTNRVYVGG